MIVGHPAHERHRIGDRLALDDTGLIQQQKRRVGDHRIVGGGFVCPFRHASDQRMLWIDLQDARRDLASAPMLALLTQHPLQPEVHVIVAGDEADRAVGQAVRHADVLDRRAERQLDRRHQRVDAGRVGCRFGSGSALASSVLGRASRSAPAPGHRLEGLFLEGCRGWNPELVDRDRSAAALRRRAPGSLRVCGLRRQRVDVLARDEVDRLLAVLHGLDIGRPA